MSNRACFASTTPYQVLSSIAVQLEKKLDADLYVFGMFENYQSVSEKIKAYGLFRDVVAVDCSKIGAPSKSEALWQMVFPRKFTKAFLGKNVVYDYCYTSSRAHPKLLLMHEITRRNKQLQVVMIEDGMGTYSSDSTQLNTKSKLRQMTNRLLGWDNLFDPHRLFVMARRPDLIELPPVMKGVSVGTMPELPANEKVCSMLFDIFGAQKEDRISERVIIFDTVRGLREVGVLYDVLDQCYQEIDEAFSHDVICKTHPRSRTTPPVSMKFYAKPFVPMEVLYSEMKDLDQRVLVGVGSTAMYSPKLVFDAEPYIIDLHKLAYNNKMYDDLMQKMRSLYRDKNKVLCPDTREEFLEVVKELTQK